MLPQIDGLASFSRSGNGHSAPPANDNRAERRGIGGGLRAIMLWHLSVLGVGAGFVLIGALVTRLAQCATGIGG